MSPEAPLSPPVYEKRVLALFDILGWKELIKHSVGPTGSPAGLESAFSWFDYIRNLTEPERTILHFGQFSDHFVISAPADDSKGYSLVSTLTCAAAERLLIRGYCSRGAIVVGDLMHRGERIYGPALVEAHEIESRIAKYPRIVLSDAAVEISEYGDWFGSQVPLRRDADGLVCLDVVGFLGRYPEHLPDYLPKIREHLRRSRALRPHDMEVRAKHDWLLNQLRALEELQRGS